MMSSTVTQTTRLVAATMHRLVLSFGRILRWAAWAIVPVVFGGSAPAWASEPSIVFDNTQNSNGGLGFTALPYGAEVTLAGTNRVVNEIDLGVSRQGSPGTADFEVSFYANNGVGGQPGTLLWDSGLYENLPLSGPPQTLSFSVPSVVVPNTFTWVAQISNSRGSQQLAVGMVEATGTTIGGFDTDWFGGPGEWTKDQAQNEARIYAVPEPSTLAILTAGAIALIGYGIRRRRVAKTAKPAAFDPQDAPAILAFPSHPSTASAARRAA